MLHARNPFVMLRMKCSACIEAMHMYVARCLTASTSRFRLDTLYFATIIKEVDLCCKLRTLGLIREVHPRSSKLYRMITTRDHPGRLPFSMMATNDEWYCGERGVDNGFESYDPLAWAVVRRPV